MHPETPEEGRTLEDLFAGRPVDVPAMLAQLKRTADALGLPFGNRRMTFNSRRAQELGKWAEAQGRGDAFHRETFLAYFRDGQNIALPKVLVDIATAAGLPKREAEAVIAERRFRDAVDADWSRSRSLGVTAVPTFSIDSHHLVGARPFAELLHWVRDRLA